MQWGDPFEGEKSVKTAFIQVLIIHSIQSLMHTQPKHCWAAIKGSGNFFLDLIEKTRRLFDLQCVLF